MLNLAVIDNKLYCLKNGAQRCPLVVGDTRTADIVRLIQRVLRRVKVPDVWCMGDQPMLSAYPVQPLFSPSGSSFHGGESPLILWWKQEWSHSLSSVSFRCSSLLGNLCLYTIIWRGARSFQRRDPSSWILEYLKAGILECVRPDVRRRHRSDSIDVFVAKNSARA
jgi:hypothetical protein